MQNKVRRVFETTSHFSSPSTSISPEQCDATNGCSTAKPLPVMDAFVEEDWMLAHLRAEMHGLLHAFLEDAGADREGFTPALLVHYYKQYSAPFAFLYQFRTVLVLVRDDLQVALYRYPYPHRRVGVDRRVGNYSKLSSINQVLSLSTPGIGPPGTPAARIFI